MFGLQSLLLMKGHLKTESARYTVLVFSVVYGLWILSPSNVWPTSTEWLRWGDMEFTQYIWQYFRRTPVLQWPVTAVQPYGEGWGNISAGVALVGIPLKLFSPLLPDEFQFLGAWTLVCFVMQGWFAERILAHFGVRRLERILGAMSIVLAPIFVFRIGMTHLDLSAQWVLLAALSLYFSDSSPRHLGRWVMLIAVSILIQIYLFVIVLTVGLAWVLRKHLFSGNQRRLANVIPGVCVMLLTGLVMWWFLGYSTYLGQAQGVGFFRLNSAAFVNPESGGNFSFSRLLSRAPIIANRDWFAEESEGFGYLGLVGLFGIAAIAFDARYWRSKIRNGANAPILVAAVVLMLVAISHRVAFVRREFELPVPSLLLDARQVFRVANRFSWLAYYLLLIVGWIALVRLARRVRLGPALLVLVLVAGAWDQWSGISTVRTSIVSSPAPLGRLDSSKWEQIGASATRLYLVPTFDVQDDSSSSSTEAWTRAARWRRLVEFAARHQLSTNFAYSSRPVTRQVLRSNADLRKQIMEQRVLPNTLLVFADQKEWANTAQTLGGRAKAMQLDELYVIITEGEWR